MTGPGRQSGHVARSSRNRLHDRHAHADIFSCNVIAVQLFNEIAKFLVQRLRTIEVRRLDNYGLATAETQAGHGVLVAHALRQAQHVMQRSIARLVTPEPATTSGRAQRRGMYGDDCFQACCRITAKDHALVVVKSRVVESSHSGPQERQESVRQSKTKRGRSGLHSIAVKYSGSFVLARGF